jgi:hypothetical protein
MRVLYLTYKGMSEPVKWKDKGMSIKIDQQGINHVIQSRRAVQLTELAPS